MPPAAMAESVRRGRAGVAVAAVIAWLALAPAGCSRRTPGGASAAAVTGSGGVGSMAIDPEGGAGGSTDPREAEAWQRAREGSEAERIRLEELVGCERLREAAETPMLRAAAIQSMAYCPDFSALPWLVHVAASAQGDEGIEALDAIVEQAARPRRASDPDDADELADGCRALLALSRASQQPRARRVRAVRALRMLAERGCVNRGDIPTELDAK